MAVDIHGPLASSRGIAAARRGVIANKRHDNSSLASLVLHVLHISSVWEIVVSTTRATIFVLGLVKNDRSSIGDLALGHGCGNMGNVAG